MTKKLITIALICTVASALAGCTKTQPAKSPAEKLKVVEKLDLPECLVVDPDSGKIYVSNVVTPNEAYWVDDNNGFITLLTPEAEIEKLRWLESSPEAPIHDPKGMCILAGRLYFTDNKNLKSCSLNTPGKVEVIALPGAQKLNDLATDGKSIWATDTETGNVFCVQPDGTSRRIQGPAGINGVTTHKGKLFAVSWDLHDLYELDPEGNKPPVPFGLDSHFTALDGIEVLDDGTFIVSDYTGNKLCSVSADRKKVTTIMKLESPADFCVDRKNSIIYVPEMLVNRAAILKLKM